MPSLLRIPWIHQGWTPAQSHLFMANKRGNNGNSERLYFLGPPKSIQRVTAAVKLKDACSLKEKQ